MTEFGLTTANQGQVQKTNSIDEVVGVQREIKEIEVQATLAKKFPRDPFSANKMLMAACTRVRFSETAIYSYRRGNKVIDGPSIRLAEEAARCWGNLKYGWREVERGNGYSIVSATCWDLESNTPSFIEFQVNHIRDTKNGPVHLNNERDIYEMVASQAARRLRKVILNQIPEDLISAATNQADLTLKGDTVDIKDAAKKMLQAFLEFNVTREQIKSYLSCEPEGMTINELTKLRKIFSSLKDYETKPQDWFRMPSLSQGIQDEAETAFMKDEAEVLEGLMKSALDAGISQQIIDSIKVDQCDLKSIRHAIDNIKVLMYEHQPTVTETKKKRKTKAKSPSVTIDSFAGIKTKEAPMRVTNQTGVTIQENSLVDIDPDDPYLKDPNADMRMDLPTNDIPEMGI